MFKPVVTIALVSSIVFSSCGGEKKEENKKEEDKKEETSKLNSIENNNIQANMLADISITGMVSEIKCAGSVKKILSAMVGVTEIDINFNSNESINHAVVKFDNKIINDKEMVSAIEKLNDGAYKVEGVDIRKIDDKTISVRKKIDEKEVTFTPSSSGSSGFALPNILDVFNIL